MAQTSADDVVPSTYKELDSFKFLQAAFPILFINNEDGSISTAGQGKNLLNAVDPSINNTMEDLLDWVSSSDFDSGDVQLSPALKSKLKRVLRDHMDLANKAKVRQESEPDYATAASAEELESGALQIQLPQSKSSVKMRRASVASVSSTASNYSVASAKRKNSLASAPVSTVSTPVPEIPFSATVSAGTHIYPTSMSMPHLPSMMTANNSHGLMLPLQTRQAITNPNTPTPGAMPSSTALPVSKKRKNSTPGLLGNSHLASNFYNNRSTSDIAIEYQEITFLYKDVEWEIKWTETHGNIHVSKTGGWMKVIVSAINRRFNFFMSHKTHKQLVLPVDNTLLTYVHVAMHFISTLPPYPFENKNCLVNYVELNKQNILNNVAECAALCRGVGKCALCDTIHEGDPKAYEYWRNYAIVNVPGESGRGMLCSVAELRAGGPFLKPQPGAVTATPLSVPPSSSSPHNSSPTPYSPALGAPPGHATGVRSAPNSSVPPATGQTSATGSTTVIQTSAAVSTSARSIAGYAARPSSASPPNVLFPGGLVAMRMPHPSMPNGNAGDEGNETPATMYPTHVLTPGYAPHAHHHGLQGHRLHHLPHHPSMMTSLPITMSMIPPHMFKAAVSLPPGKALASSPAVATSSNETASTAASAPVSNAVAPSEAEAIQSETASTAEASKIAKVEDVSAETTENVKPVSSHESDNEKKQNVNMSEMARDALDAIPPPPPPTNQSPSKAVLL